MKVDQYQFFVEKDTYNKIPVVVAEYEVPILKDIHGDNHVLNFDGKDIDENGIGEPVRQVEVGKEEYDRLIHKYGTVLVEKNIGKQSAFMRLINPKPARRAKEATPAE